MKKSILLITLICVSVLKCVSLQELTKDEGFLLPVTDRGKSKNETDDKLPVDADTGSSTGELVDPAFTTSVGAAVSDASVPDLEDVSTMKIQPAAVDISTQYVGDLDQFEATTGAFKKEFDLSTQYVGDLDQFEATTGAFKKEFDLSTQHVGDLDQFGATTGAFNNEFDFSTQLPTDPDAMMASTMKADEDILTTEKIIDVAFSTETKAEVVPTEKVSVPLDLDLVSTNSLFIDPMVDTFTTANVVNDLVITSEAATMLPDGSIISTDSDKLNKDTVREMLTTKVLKTADEEFTRQIISGSRQGKIQDEVKVDQPKENADDPKDDVLGNVAPVQGQSSTEDEDNFGLSTILPLILIACCVIISIVIGVFFWRKRRQESGVITGGGGGGDKPDATFHAEGASNGAAASPGDTCTVNTVPPVEPKPEHNGIPMADDEETV